MFFEMKTGIINIGVENMKKDHLNPHDTEYDSPEEKAQADREDKIFKHLMTCSTILTTIVGIIIVLILVYIYLNQ